MHRIGGIAVVLLLFAGACGDDASDDVAVSEDPDAEVTTTTAATTPTEMPQFTLDLVDTSRPTEAGAGMPHQDERRLPTDVYLPAGPGPFPFVAFAHGLDGHPRKFTQLLSAWAEAGYAVAAPAFPLSNDEVPGEATWTDVGNQPGDISFVIDELLAANEDPASPVYGAIDPERIGIAGLSLGGATTYGVAFNDCCLDERPIAAMVLDGARLHVGGEFDFSRGLPLMIVHADEDPALPYEDAVEAYAEAATPKWFVTLHEFAHASPFENDPDPADDLVTASTIAFWDLYLAGDAEAEQRVVDAIEPADLATLEFELS
jgi:dienelactone hydrolase